MVYVCQSEAVADKLVRAGALATVADPSSWPGLCRECPDPVTILASRENLAIALRALAMAPSGSRVLLPGVSERPRSPRYTAVTKRENIPGIGVLVVTEVTLRASVKTADAWSEVRGEEVKPKEKK